MAIIFLIVLLFGFPALYLLALWIETEIFGDGYGSSLDAPFNGLIVTPILFFIIAMLASYFNF